MTELERFALADEWRRFLKNQRARVEHKLAGMERRIVEARYEPMEEFEARVRRASGGWKKPNLDQYEARWR